MLFVCRGRLYISSWAWVSGWRARARARARVCVRVCACVCVQTVPRGLLAKAVAHHVKGNEVGALVVKCELVVKLVGFPAQAVAEEHRRGVWAFARDVDDPQALAADLRQRHRARTLLLAGGGAGPFNGARAKEGAARKKMRGWVGGRGATPGQAGAHAALRRLSRT